MRPRALLSILLCCFSTIALHAQSKPMPQIAHQGPNYTFLLDNKPYFILGAQIHNSSSWPVMLPKAMKLAEELHANTVEAPVYWETMEPRPGVYDFSNVDAVIAQARAHHFHLILLWFGSWKTCCNYTPEWVKTNPSKYPRTLTRNGDPTAELSPFTEANLNADKTAFAALLRHIKDTDAAEQTVIMIQVENEAGALGTVRDFSPAANKLFAGPVPEILIRALHKQPGTWQEVFGKDADESFSAWGISRYINAVAAAGKAEYALPMYVNTWLGTPDSALRPGFDYPSGGPTYNVLDIWKAVAPAIDVVGPDIYLPNSEMYRQVLRQFHRPDNPIWVPETIGFSAGGSEDVSRFLFYVLGEQAIGYSPFGLDTLPENAFTDGRSMQLEYLAKSYQLLGSMDRPLAEALYAGRVQTAVQEPFHSSALLDFGKWKAVITFGLRHPPSDPAALAKVAPGRVLVAPIGPDEFLVAGFNVRVVFALANPQPHEKAQYLRVEEGSYDGSKWSAARWLNGDETFTGIQFRSEGAIVHARLGTY